MVKAILTMLATAIAVLATPVVAQAVQLKVGEKELANGSTVLWQSTSLKASYESPAGSLTCTSSEFEGKATKDQAEVAELTVAKTTFTGCTSSGVSADVTSNATAEKPWTLQLDSAEENGQFKAHLDPAASSTIQLKVQIQVFGFSVGTCDYNASTVQFTGEESSDVLHVEGSGQFTKQEGGSSECGKTATLSGEAQLESGGAAVRAGGYTELCEVPEMPCPEESSFENNLVVNGALEAKTSLTLTPVGGNQITCTVSTIEKKYALAKEAKPVITGEFVSITFGGPCTEKNGACTVAATTEPWVIKLKPLGKGNGAVKVTKGAKGNPTIGALCGVLVCGYTASSLDFKLVNNGKGKQSQMTATKVPLVSTGGAGCAATAELTATWALTTPAKKNPGVD